MSDLISRQAAIDIERNATVDTNPSHFEANQKFIQFMDDAEISSFGRWQWSNGFNTALTAVGIDLKKLPSAQPEPCEDAVSRKAVYDAMVEKGQRSRRYKLGEIWELNGTEIREALDTVPSVTPKRKRGKWIDETFKPWGLVYHPYRCDQCGEHSEADSNFCPNCGADMRGEQNERLNQQTGGD